MEAFNMRAVEFDADVKNLSVEIPPNFSELESKRVRVIALFEDDTATRPGKTRRSFIDEMTEKPFRIDDFTPLSREEAHER